MKFLRNNVRIKSDRSYYYKNDPYDVPQILRAARTKNDFGLPRSVTFFQENEKVNRKPPRFIDEDEEFMKHMSSFWGSAVLATWRLITSCKALLFKDVTHPIKISNSVSASTHSEIEITEMSVSKESLLARAANTISKQNLTEADESNIQVVGSSMEEVEELNYEDGAVRKFKLKLGGEESVNLIEVSLMYDKSLFDTLLEEKHDVKSIVLSEKCACVLWVWSEQSRIVVITEGSNPHAWSLQQWYRKILSDVALVNSRLIRHPFFWHPVVRRRLGRAMRHFKKLYRKLAEIEAVKKGLSPSTVTLFDTIPSYKSRIEEIDDYAEEPVDARSNDAFLIGNFVPGCWDYLRSPDYPGTHCPTVPGRTLKGNPANFHTPCIIGDCNTSTNMKYHLQNIETCQDGTLDSGNFNGKPNSYGWGNQSQIESIDGQAKTWRKHCDEDIEHSEQMQNAASHSLMSDCTKQSFRDDMMLNRTMSSEALRIRDENRGSISRNRSKARQIRKQKEPDHCTLSIEE